MTAQHPPQPRSTPEGFAAESTLLDSIQTELRRRLPAEQHSFRGLMIQATRDDEIVFSVPNGFLRDRLSRQFMPLLTEIVKNLDPRIARARIVTAASESRDSRLGATPHRQPAKPEAGPASAARTSSGAPEQLGSELQTLINRLDSAASASPAPPTAVKAPSQAARRPPAATRYAGTPLAETHRFQDFVVGPCNRLAHAAALAVAQNPAQSYNPLFVHASQGLGKTHLLQGIAHAVSQFHPNLRVVYLSCEDFTNRYIAGIQDHTISEFRDFYRGVDVLLVDDVQFLAKKTQTQEEFFHTFNALHVGRQIVLSADCPPEQIVGLEDRLVSRFKGGLEVDMTPPCLETRRAIVRRKAKFKNAELPDDVEAFVAESVTTNVRELEGAVNKVLGLASLTGRTVSLSLAQEALAETSTRRFRATTIPEILIAVSDEFSVTVKDMLGKARTQVISLPRQIAMYLARHLTEHSLQEVGRHFGNRDHTTVLYAIRKIAGRATMDVRFRETLQKLSQAAQTARGEATKS